MVKKDQKDYAITHLHADCCKSGRHLERILPHEHVWVAVVESVKQTRAVQTIFFQIFQQVEKAFAPAAWGNQYHLFALSLGLRRPIYTFSSFLKNPQAIEPAEHWAVGHQTNLQALRDAFLAKENGTGVASQYLAREDDSSSRPLVILLAHSHFSALLPRPGCSIFEIPIPYSFVIPPLR